MSFKDAAIKVLRCSKEPMTAREITNAALSQGFISTTGKTPEESMAARLHVDVARNPNTPFRKNVLEGQKGEGRVSARWELNDKIASGSDQRK
jgi:hypothetical protein